MAQLTLTLLPQRLAIARLAADAPIPDWALKSDFFSITRTADELSIVCGQSDAPADVQCQGDWFGLKVAAIGLYARFVEPQWVDYARVPMPLRNLPRARWPEQHWSS